MKPRKLVLLASLLVEEKRIARSSVEWVSSSHEVAFSRLPKSQEKDILSGCPETPSEEQEDRGRRRTIRRRHRLMG